MTHRTKVLPDTVDVSSGESSGSSDSESEENLASQKTSCGLAKAVKGENLQNEMIPQPRRLRSLEERKAKLAIFFTVRGLLK